MFYFRDFIAGASPAAFLITIQCKAAPFHDHLQPFGPELTLQQSIE